MPTEVKEKVKPILIKDPESGEVKYTLEFSRDTVKWAERRGFKIGEVTDFPATNIPLLFFYSFRMHHREVSQQTTDTILDEIGGATGSLLERLVALYNVTLESLFNNEESERKNSKFTVEL